MWTGNIRPAIAICTLNVQLLCHQDFAQQRQIRFVIKTFCTRASRFCTGVTKPAPAKGIEAAFHEPPITSLLDHNLLEQRAAQQSSKLTVRGTSGSHPVPESSRSTSSSTALFSSGDPEVFFSMATPVHQGRCHRAVIVSDITTPCELHPVGEVSRCSRRSSSGSSPCRNRPAALPHPETSSSWSASPSGPEGSTRDGCPPALSFIIAVL